MRKNKLKYYCLIPLLFCFFSSCAVNTLGLPGLTAVTFDENEHNFRTKVTSWGLFLSTRPIDRGISLGYTKREYINPKVIEKPSPRDVNSFLNSLEQNNWHPVDQQKDILPGVIAFSNKSSGIIFQVNAHSIGLKIGMNTCYILKVNDKFNGIFAVNLN